jgi:hypothetical protein
MKKIIRRFYTRENPVIIEKNTESNIRRDLNNYVHHPYFQQYLKKFIKKNSPKQSELRELR